MDLIIVGNGFDLAHGLATSYNDFKAFLLIEDESAVDFLESLYHETSGGNYLLWRDFEEALEYPDIEHANDIEEVLETDKKDAVWLMNVLRAAFIKWVDDISFLSSDKLEIIHPFSGYLKQNNIFLNFNYTRTLEEVYSITNVLHIHGMVDNRCTPISNNIIFGHKRIEGKSKFIKATEKKSEEIIKSKCAWFRKLSENVDGNIVIMGLSCSDADKPYLLEIRNALPNNNWVFYYHDNADKENKEKCAIELGLTMDKYQLLPDDLGK